MSQFKITVILGVTCLAGKAGSNLWSNTRLDVEAGRYIAKEFEEVYGKIIIILLGNRRRRFNELPIKNNYSRIKNLLNAIFEQINIRNSSLFLRFLCSNLTSFKFSEFNISHRTEVIRISRFSWVYTSKSRQRLSIRKE